MEFKRRAQVSSLTQNHLDELINDDDIIEILTSEYLLEQRAHAIVTKEGTYNDAEVFQYGIHPDRIKELEKALQTSHTIVVKELEHWNHAIKNQAQSMGHNVNVHLYLSPSQGTTFDWHADDRDVTIIMQRGVKTFQVEELDGIKEYVAKPGSQLYIPYGAKHRALPGKEASIHLSFGVWPQDMTIKTEYQRYPIPLVIPL